MQRNARLSFCVPVGQLQHQIGNALGSVGSEVTLGPQSFVIVHV